MFSYGDDRDNQVVLRCCNRGVQMITLDLDETNNIQKVREYYVNTIHTATRVALHAVIPNGNVDCDKDAEQLYNFLMREVPALTFEKLRGLINATAK